jgi:hypothetical protein
VSDSGAQDTGLAAAWPGFVDEVAQRLRRAGEKILALVGDDLDRAEGIRVLLRDVRMSMERVIENIDRDFPFFSEIYDATYHLIGDTPDYAMHAARIDRTKQYVIRGKLGTSARFSFTSQGPAPGTPDGDVMGALIHHDARAVFTGTLDSEQMSFEHDGTFEIVVSPTRPPTGNWLPMGPETNLILVRNEFHDRFTHHWRHSPTMLQIGLIDGPATPAPLQEASLTAAIGRLAGEVGTVTLGRPRFRDDIRAHGDGAFSGDQQRWSAAGGNPRTTFQVAYWELQPDEALIVEVDRVPDSSFWILGLTNTWMESLDFRFHQINLNKHTAEYLPAGGLRVVVAAEDPGLPNWLDTAGHRRGTLMWRWNYPRSAPEIPRVRHIPWSDIARSV